MGFLLKVIFWCGLLTLTVSFYSGEMLRFFNNQVRLNGNAVSNDVSSSVNIVHSLEIPIQNDGHYWVDMNVNNSPITFIVDTGASTVTLSHEDGQKLNLYLNDNDYTILVNTAGGRTSMADINIDVISFGIIELYNVRALVARPGMLNVSLLGMNYLNELDRFEFRNQKLILEQ